ncbi:MAG: sulfatase, partial [Bdellovibrionales bacterium]|jgi:arylsulfatase A-like enzyme|nr:sulfatase [Bdellovibrionales bacterium]
MVGQLVALILGTILLNGNLAYSQQGLTVRSVEQPVGLAVVQKQNEISCRDCNVIFVGLDALQGRRLGTRGYRAVTPSGRKSVTPNLDAFAKRSVDFAQAISPASWTVPVYLSVFSSTFPSYHGLTNRYKAFTPQKKELNNVKSLRPNLLVVAELYKAAGYHTGAFTGDSGVSAVLGYDKGFDVYYDRERFGGLKKSLQEFEKWITTTKGKPFFAFVHGYDSHSQFASQNRYPLDNVSKEMRAKLSSKAQEAMREKALNGEKLNPTQAEIEAWRSWYDNRVFDADQEFGSLIGFLEKKGLIRNTIVVVFSDHGTEFFEHGGVDHGHSLFDELVHVPLMIYSPKLKKARVVKEQVSTMDVLPTAIELSGLTFTPDTSSRIRSQMKGQSLLKTLTGESFVARTAYIETDLRNAIHLRGMRTATGWKYIMNIGKGSEELYNLNTDPGEKIDLSKIEQHSVQLSKLRAELFEHIKTNLDGGLRALSMDCLPVYPGQCE